ncbi:hypothetical protein K502DRAFT_350137 [Neoconidiobolus thromboides FSU 785]|nr:hypothetical protein K502DRAFT_350137 [Neoconidiobolus thromboides FSU 785]
MEDNTKPTNNIDKILNSNQVSDQNQFDDGGSEDNIPVHGVDISTGEKIDGLKLYSENGSDVLSKSEASKLLSTNPKLSEKYTKLKRMVADINKEMREFNDLFGSEKTKILKRKKKLEKQDNKLTKKIGDDLVFKSVLDGKISIRTGADILGLSYNTFHKRVCRTKQKMTESVEVNDLRKNGKNKKANEETNGLIYDFISRNHDTTLLQVRHFLLTKQIDISKATLSRIKHKLDITYKQAAQVSKMWNDKGIILKRKLFIEEYKKLMKYKFIYIDEVYFNRHTINESEDGIFRGQKYILTPESTPKSVNYIGAVSESGIESYKIVDKTKTINNNQDDFDDFMDNLYSKNSDKQIVYVFNSANTHVVSNALKKSIKSSNSYILTLPEYSVFLSPIELFFNALKAGINDLPYDENSDIIRSILEVQDKVGDIQHCDGYFKHAKSYISACENCCMLKGNIFKPNTLLPKDQPEGSVENEADTPALIPVNNRENQTKAKIYTIKTTGFSEKQFNLEKIRERNTLARQASDQENFGAFQSPLF